MTVRVDEVAGGGPSVVDAHDVAAGFADHAGGGVPERPAQPFRFRDCEFAVTAEQLEPADEVGGHAHECEPRPVRVEPGEREPAQTGVFESADVVLDVGVGTHEQIGTDGTVGLVGVVAPVSERVGGEQ